MARRRSLLLLGFLLYRVLKVGSDSRFDTIRAHFFKFLGKACSTGSVWGAIYYRNRILILLL